MENLEKLIESMSLEKKRELLRLIRPTPASKIEARDLDISHIPFKDCGNCAPSMEEELAKGIVRGGVEAICVETDILTLRWTCPHREERVWREEIKRMICESWMRKWPGTLEEEVQDEN